ncbi:MAG: class I SAM-dependent methyltransferase [Gammaproteobacteria bacterium]|nr:class I SAM-dependent methyltransferase [Gammaproteobacteria bacterium]MBU1723094.1 class I SAM-dependent methyltransferase [Gammaproteobacteria bacterium]MBU2007395.1 class I SAM-dependent methyltransferase [Gammaproteobacteria bacterium]
MDKEKPLNVISKKSSMPSGVSACRQWYATLSGQATLAGVQKKIAAMTADVFGYYALETGVLTGTRSFLQESRIASRFSLGMVQGEQSSITGSPVHLPFAFNNLDLVIASHALDCTQEPHQVLREIERVLVAEGHCILIGFNPFSFKGLGNLRHFHQRKELPCHLYSAFRVREWLSVLGFDVLETVTTGFSPALGGERTFHRTRWMEKLGERFHLATGNVYIIHAQKKVSNMTLLPSLRKPASVLRPGIMVNPGAGRISPQERHDGK